MKTALVTVAAMSGLLLGPLSPAASASNDVTALSSASAVIGALDAEGASPASTAAAVRDTSGGATAAVPGTSLRLSLPGADVVGTADGMTVVTGAGESSATLQNLDGGDGSRVAFVIASIEDPSRYSVTYGGAASLAVKPDGSVRVLDAASQPIATVDEPWATDASGRSVPTHFEVSGATLTQVVDLSGHAIAYPVVADPVTHHWWGTEVSMSESQTAKLKKVIAAGAAASGLVAFLAGAGVITSPGAIPAGLVTALLAFGYALIDACDWNDNGIVIYLPKVGGAFCRPR